MSREILDPYKRDVLEKQLPGYHLHYIPETTSTMTLAEEHYRAGGEFPSIFLTDHQTKGVGREGRSWVDKAEASILVSGLVAVDESSLPSFPDMIALYACKIISNVTGVEGKIKYPNDLVIKNKKTGGLLVLNIYEGDQYKGTNIGIGINIHYTKDEVDHIPTDYGATALDLHTYSPNPRQPLLVAIFTKLQSLAVDTGVFQTNLQTQQDQNNLWRSYSSLLGREIQVEEEDDVLVRGRVVDTQIGEGIYIENTFRVRQFNQFSPKMKVRLLD